MFSLTALSCVGMAFGAARPAMDAFVHAALFWIILFFSVMSGLDKTFVQEQEKGTFWSLRVYAAAQAVFIGKFLYNFLLLCAMSAMLTMGFLLFMDVAVENPGGFACLLLLGNCGLAGAATFIGALVSFAGGRNQVFAVLSFPVILPLFLVLIQLTAEVFTGPAIRARDAGMIMVYDLVLLGVTSILFDYLWYD